MKCTVHMAPEIIDMALKLQIVVDMAWVMSAETLINASIMSICLMRNRSIRIAAGIAMSTVPTDEAEMILPILPSSKPNCLR